VSAGSFRASVPLEPGANVIDVMATAGEREPALAAVRVVREVPVEVPDLDGLQAEAAQEAVDGAGLELAAERGGGLLDDILPGEPAVCEQDPEPDTLVRPGSVVRVRVAKNC
jgi:beta-lactam-binding protein with PASTA domain